MIIAMQGQNILANSYGLLKAIAGLLDQLLADPDPHQPPSAFNLKGPATISIADYLARLFKYMNCSLSNFIYALALLDRVQEYQTGLVLHRRNIHRLLLVASVVAAKYMDDFFYKNSYYANVGGVQLATLNALEAEFLTMISFHCHVDPDTFDHYLVRLQAFAETNQRQQDQKQIEHGDQNSNEKRAGVLPPRRERPVEAGRDGREGSARPGKERQLRVEPECVATVKQ